MTESNLSMGHKQHGTIHRGSLRAGAGFAAVVTNRKSDWQRQGPKMLLFCASVLIVGFAVFFPTQIPTSH